MTYNYSNQYPQTQTVTASDIRAAIKRACALAYDSLTPEERAALDAIIYGPYTVFMP